MQEAKSDDQAERDRDRGEQRVADAAQKEQQHEHAEGAADEMIQKPIKKGLDLARSQGARLFELRFALVITRLLIKKGKGLEARDLLAPIYSRVTEGFDALDMKEAKALLDELAQQKVSPLNVA